MNKNSFILLALVMAKGVVCSNLYAQACASENTIYSFQYGDHDYEIVRERVSWVDAAACAVERGGHLVHIEDEGEQTAIYDAILNGANIDPDYAGPFSALWMGASDRSAEGTWLWDGDNDGIGTHFWTGEGANGNGGGSVIPGMYHNWGGKSTTTIQEPDNWQSSQHAASLVTTTWGFGIAGEWNDLPETALFYYIIEKQAPTGGLGENMDPLLSFHPVPADRTLHLALKTGREKYWISILDVFGKVFLKKMYLADSEFIELDVSTLESGVYVLQLQRSGRYPISKRFIISR